MLAQMTKQQLNFMIGRSATAHPAPPTAKDGGSGLEAIQSAPAHAPGLAVQHERKALMASSSTVSGPGGQPGMVAAGKSKRRQRRKGRRQGLSLAQIPHTWTTTLQRISVDLQMYSHQHAMLFDNAKTTVRLGLYDGDTVVAVKRTHKPADPSSLAKALREKDTLKALDHPHIVRYFGHAVDNSFIYIALEPFVRPLVRGQKARPMTLRDLVMAQLLALVEPLSR